jgi:uncharacterized protein (TIGR02996 family)
MPDESAFIRTILDHPDADGPRLVYADWLEEEGETARAEFIRVQIELSHLPESDSRRDELAKREQALLKRYRRRWVRRVGSFVKNAKFRLGLVDWVSVPASAFIRYGPRIFERAPVTGIVLTRARRYVDRIAGAPCLRELRGLELWADNLTGADIRPLTESPHVQNLRSLELDGNPLGDEGAQILAHAANLPNLSHLSLYLCEVNAAGMEALGEASLPRLDSLSVAASQFGDVGLTAFLAGSLPGQLAKLELSRARLTPAAAQALARSAQLTKLEFLDLTDNPIENAGAIALANSHGLSGLDWLVLRACGIGPAGARALAQSRYLGSIRRLGLERNNFGPSTKRLLRRRFGSRVMLDGD